MLLAVDLGSISFKVGVFDSELKLLGSGSGPLKQICSPGGRVELDVEHVMVVFKKAVKDAIAEAGVECGAICAMAVTSQAQTFTVLDSTGRAKMPFISWQDGRAHEACETLKQEASLADYAEHGSFGQLLSSLQISQIKNLQMTQKGFIDKDDRIVDLPTFFVLKCTGHAVIDNNLAAMDGLFSLKLNDWLPAALNVCQLQVEQMAKVVPIGAVAAKTNSHALEFGLPEGIPLVLAGNDQTAGAFGVPLDEHGGLLITLGTALVVYACIDDGSGATNPEIIRGPYPGGLHYRLTTDSCGGNVMNWARTVLLGCEDEAAFFSQVAKAEPGCKGLVFDADLPLGNGAWRNIGLHHATPELARAVVENISNRVAKLVRNIGVDLSAKSVVAAGGGSRSSVWIEILSQLLGVEITVIEADPRTGAARMAKIALENRHNY